MAGELAFRGADQIAHAGGLSAQLGKKLLGGDTAIHHSDVLGLTAAAADDVDPKTTSPQNLLRR